MQHTENEILALKPGEYRLGGTIAKQMETFFQERIFSEFAKNEICGEAENAFREKIDDASGIYGIWQGEFWGKWIISAVRAAEYEQNASMLEFLRNSAHRLLELQEPSGYIGTYRNADFVFAADPEKTCKILGWRCNWNWNVWCRKYTLWGLLEVWRVTRDEAILQGASKLLDHLIVQLKCLHLELRETGVLAGSPSCSILKPVLQLYRATQKAEYLDFARDIVCNWDRTDNARPNLIANSLSGIPVHQWYPAPEEWAKVYEMQSCFDGLLDFYRLTGDVCALTASEAFHDLLLLHERNLVLSVGVNDIFKHGAVQLNTISEPCDVLHWMRLNYELFVQTGKKRYLDDFELAFVNPFLASCYRDGKWGARGVRSHGRHMTDFQQANMNYHHCCVDNLPRGFMNAAQAFVMYRDRTLFTNLYTEFQADAEFSEGRIKLEISGDYLRSGTVEIHCRAELNHPVVWKLRIPGWAVSSRLECGKIHLTGIGDWFEIPLESGECTVRLAFERKLEVRDHEFSEESREWCFTRWQEPGMEDMFRTERASTLLYGPLLLARSKYVGNTEEEMFGSSLPRGFDCKLTPENSDAVRCCFDAEFTSKGKTFHTRVCDYASCGNEVHAEDCHFFSIFF